MQHPFTYLFSNLSGLTSWLLQYLTPSYILLILLAILFIKKFFKEKVILLLYFALPFAALALFGKLIYPRHMFLMSVMLLPLAAWGLSYLVDFTQKRVSLNIPKGFYLVIITIIFILYPGFISAQFAYSPEKAQIADMDRNQYINGWAAGWGVKESVIFFTKEAEKQKIFVATEGTFGLMPEAMEMYLIGNKNVTIKGYWPIDIFPKELLEVSKKMPTYLIFYQPQHRVLP